MIKPEFKKIIDTTKLPKPDSKRFMPDTDCPYIEIKRLERELAAKSERVVELEGENKHLKGELDAWVYNLNGSLEEVIMDHRRTVESHERLSKELRILKRSHE